MAEEKTDSRPWWKKKTNVGAGCWFLGLAIPALYPTVPVIFAAGSMVVTTATVGAILQGLGGALGFYGVADRAAKAKAEK
ncbi:MAG: hypothetical protein M0P69_18730 [Bacteroidales bacterium]|nr:hypothetical protein [Bacteroidales bacterium]